MKNQLGAGNGMVPHYSGTTLDAQARYAAGAKDILGRFLAGKEQDPANVIVTGGDYATKACTCPLALIPKIPQQPNPSLQMVNALSKHRLARKGYVSREGCVRNLIMYKCIFCLAISDVSLLKYEKKKL